VDVEENTNACCWSKSTWGTNARLSFYNPILIHKSEGFAPTPRQVQLFLAGIYCEGSLRTGLKPGDSSQDNVSKEKSKNILGAPRAKESEISLCAQREREKARDREDGPYSIRGEQNPTTNGKRTATGKSDGVTRRAAAGREREDGERSLERNGEERPALLW